MKSIYSVAPIISCLFLLTACPVATSYPLANKGDVQLDKQLLGVWSNESVDTEASGITVSKGTELNTYAVHVDEKGTMFMADGEDFTGWIALLNGKTFFVLQQVIDKIPTSNYYVYHYNVDKSKLTTSDISLNVNGTESITSITAFQEEVIASMATEGCLANKIEWYKKK